MNKLTQTIEWTRGRTGRRPWQQRSWRQLAGGAACGLALAMVALAPATAQARPAVQDQVEQDQAQAEEERFIRFASDPAGGGTLQTSIVTYENADGVRVDLIGAVHVGDAAYYDLLQERFASYESLLYEMVMPKGTDIGQRNRAAEDPPLAMQLIGTMQKAMQMALELEYQTQALDYTPKNFVHADMDLETFMRLQDERGEGFLQMMIDNMLHQMNQPQDPDYQPVSLLEIMDAMNAPDRARRLKLLFARELSRADDLTAMMEGEDGSVILTERNKVALEVLDDRVEMGEKNLALFYGAAHLRGMEEMLEERGFEMVGEPEYLVAWDMTPSGKYQKQMRERMRQTIVEQAVGEAAAAEGEGGAAMLKAMNDERDELRRENESLRRQLDALRRQNEALRREAEGQGDG